MTTPHTLWYKQFWPWALITLPGSVVIASLFTAYLAAHQSDALVADDYYKAGLAINQELTAQHVAALQHISAHAKLDTSNAMLLVDLHGNLLTQPTTLLLHLVHPTLADQDSNLVLTRTASGQYAARWPTQFTCNINIRWQAQLNDADKRWELRTHVTLPQQVEWDFGSKTPGDAT